MCADNDFNADPAHINDRMNKFAKWYANPSPLEKVAKPPTRYVDKLRKFLFL
jgi:hypothetical protein